MMLCTEGKHVAFDISLAIRLNLVSNFATSCQCGHELYAQYEAVPKVACA